MVNEETKLKLRILAECIVALKFQVQQMENIIRELRINGK